MFGEVSRPLAASPEAGTGMNVTSEGIVPVTGTRSPRDRPCLRTDGARRDRRARMRPNCYHRATRPPGRPASGGSARVIWPAIDDSMAVDIACSKFRC